MTESSSSSEPWISFQLRLSSHIVIKNFLGFAVILFLSKIGQRFLFPTGDPLWIFVKIWPKSCFFCLFFRQRYPYGFLSKIVQKLAFSKGVPLWIFVKNRPKSCFFESSIPMKFCQKSAKSLLFRKGSPNGF